MMALLDRIFILSVAVVLFALAPVATAQERNGGINMGRNDRIVIVGGGPAGVHYATLLVKKGFTNITILEQSHEVGGKSKTVLDPQGGYPHELGTCYATALYQPVFDLLKEYDPTNTLIPFIPTVKGHTWVNRDANQSVVDYNRYALQLAVQAVGPSPLPKLMATVDAAFASYISLHTSILGVYDYGLPPRPSNWTRLNMTGFEFLKQNKLLVLEGFFRFVFQQQGYGSLDESPAFYMLWWVHPDTIRQKQAADSKGQPWVYVLSKGYQSLWKAMVDKYPSQIDVRVNTKVIQITRTNPIVITVQTNNVVPGIIWADHLVMATDLGYMVTLPSDLNLREFRFSKNLASSAFVVTLFQSDASPIESVSQWWPSRGVGAAEGQLQLTRNSRLALFNPLPAHRFPSDPVATNWGVNATGRQSRVAYQFFNRQVRTSDSAASKKQLLADLADAAFDNATIHTQVVHSYFPRCNLTQLQQGVPWAVWENQGRIKTTWIGSSVSFESVLDVVVYNNNLINRVNMTN
ncbi:hypothetical protein H257_02346 [Aphanomyces astaci]|uniref:Amine oxidase domain-containing protein n=1 Tax=Aphanomyces astaci TaxID=112090 RepID=W4H3N3_APHAT|nr:hypothetical protein H257_02346 [Aphanomyces astaci]ETV85763.1 hypothetical protein H257_02346 [Aphanomyces astaci]RQM30947.1 hypothetical protein B5M09_011483 [Aphanomyces astaci]|eukprot:XP_009824235.1 hypothetical protein H257_02346 [Aphanomyces astaci]